MTRSSRSTRTRLVLLLTALILSLFLATMPAFAADPEEADPDPGLTSGPSSGSARVLILTDLAELDRSRLAPGRYRVRIVDDEGTQAVFEIVVRRQG